MHRRRHGIQKAAARVAAEIDRDVCGGRNRARDFNVELNFAIGAVGIVLGPVVRAAHRHGFQRPGAPDVPGGEIG